MFGRIVVRAVVALPPAGAVVEEATVAARITKNY